MCLGGRGAARGDLHERWRERFGVEIIDGIGTTEILHIFLSNRPGQSRPGSTGLVVPGYEARIVDDEGQPVASGEIGNLRVKGDSTMSYYWNQPEKTKAALFGEWIQTGDKYYQDKDGYFWYCGRADDMLKVGGIWVSPVEVENTLVGHPAVLEVAVVGHEDTRSARQAQGLRGAEGRPAPPPPPSRKSSRASSRTSSRPTSIRGGSSSFPRSPRPPRARSSASSCGSERAPPRASTTAVPAHSGRSGSATART